MRSDVDKARKNLIENNTAGRKPFNPSQPLMNKSNSGSYELENSGEGAEATERQGEAEKRRRGVVATHLGSKPTVAPQPPGEGARPSQ